MRLTPADWSIVALYFLFNVAVGLYYKRRAGRDTAEFFLSGRNVPWWLAGTSMVATTFAADTPLAVTGLVAKNGVAGNWLWWNLLASGMLTVFFYARLWRRSGVMTDIEFAEIRYAGPPAAFLRGFRALYLGLLINCIILGWVNLAMVKILQLLFGVGKLEALAMVLGLIALTSAISTLSGLWGVEMADVSAIRPSTSASASSLPTPNSNCRILTIARLTQPRMMQLISTPRYNARKPRRKAAGRPA